MMHTVYRDLSPEKRKFLLAFSLELASVRTKAHLQETINGPLKKILQFNHSTIFLLNRNSQSVNDFFSEPESVAEESPFREYIHLATCHTDEMGYNFDEISETRNVLPYLKDSQDLGKALLLNLYQENKAIGHWILLIRDNTILKDDQLEFIKLLANHLTIVVSKILAEDTILKLKTGSAMANANANDKIEKQLIEINRYKQQSGKEKTYLKEEPEISYSNSEIVGNSPNMQNTFRLMAQVAPSASTVLIFGETGTGKELIARAIHNHSPRKNKLMVKVNCAALPVNLIESELFGHERGSFTGATDRRLGKFELANGGTLFLDEIGEMPLELQVKLLRALQEREIERVGGRGTIKVDVRIIAATNRDLEKGMAEGRFRSDLYYRLNIFPISVPPLRDHQEDIPLLVSHFIQRFAKKARRNIKALNNSILQEMMQYNWPGNIRELENLIERSILLANGDTIRQIHLPSQKQHSSLPVSREDFVIKTMDEHEREFILKTLKYCSSRISGEDGAAQLLGVPASTLNSKMKRLGIRREHIC